jgi:hypothetical protein
MLLAGMINEVPPLFAFVFALGNSLQHTGDK